MPYLKCAVLHAVIVQLAAARNSTLSVEDLWSLRTPKDEILAGEAFGIPRVLS